MSLLCFLVANVTFVVDQALHDIFDSKLTERNDGEVENINLNE